MTTREELLELRMERARQQNAEIARRHQEVEADKKRAAEQKALVDNRVTTNPNDMMPAERNALKERSDSRANVGNVQRPYDSWNVSNQPPQGKMSAFSSQRINQYENQQRTSLLETKVNKSRQKSNGKNNQIIVREIVATKSTPRNPFESTRSNKEQTLRSYKPAPKTRLDTASDVPPANIPISKTFWDTDDEDDGDFFQNVAPLEADAVIMSSDVAASGESTHIPWDPHSRSIHTSSVTTIAQVIPTLVPVPNLVHAANQDLQNPFYSATVLQRADAVDPLTEVFPDMGVPPPIPMGVTPHRSISPAKSSGVPAGLKFLPNMDFSVPPPTINKSYRDQPPLSFGSGRLAGKSFEAHPFGDSALPNLAPPTIPYAIPPYQPYQNLVSPSVHPGYPDRNISPEQGHTMSYPCMPSNVSQPGYATTMSDTEPGTYSSDSDPFGGQFSAMGLPSVNQMAEAFGAMANERLQQNHSNNLYQDTNTKAFKEYRNSEQTASSISPQEVVLNVGGVEIPKTKAEQLLKKVLSVAYRDLETGQSSANSQNNDNSESNENGMELLNLILHSNCDVHSNNGSLNGRISQCPQGMSRPLLGRGNSDQCAAGKPELGPIQSRSTPNHNVGQLSRNTGNHRTIFGRDATVKETVSNHVGPRPILGRGASNEDYDGAWDISESETDRHSEASGTDSVPKVESRSGSSDESSESYRSKSSKQSQSSKKKDVTKAPPKMSALQARMAAVRNESSLRFSRSHVMKNSGVVQVSYKGQNVDVLGSSVPLEPGKAVDEQPPPNFKEGTKMSGLDLHTAHYKARREVGRPYGDASEPSRQPKARTPSNNTTFACADVREKDKLAEETKNLGMLEEKEPTDTRVEELVNKKSLLEDALEEAKNENLIMEMKLVQLRLQKNGVN